MGAFTITDLLGLPALQGSQIAAGRAGMSRVITAVNVMEVPDIESFVRPGDLLLTTAYPLRDRVEDMPRLIETLHARGLAALAVKLGRYLDYLPTDALQRADALAFPVLVVPDNLSFNEVISAAFAIILSDDRPEVDHTEAIRERLTSVALAGGGLDAIARTLALALDRSIRLSAGGAQHACDAEGRLVDWSSTHPWLRFPIVVGGIPRGTLEVDGSTELTVTQDRLVRQACFAAALFVAQAHAAVELDERLRTVFLEELVTGGEADRAILRERSRLFSWNLEGAQAVVLARLGVEIETAAAAERVPPAQDGSTALIWSRGSEVVALVPGSVVGGPQGWARDWKESLDQHLGQRAVVAVGSVVGEPRELSRSHTHAREALAIAEATGRDLVSHQHLAVERLLLSVGREHLDDLATSQIGALEESDRRTGGHLCRTLGAYLGLGNAALAGRELGVHYNTMKHRLARIEAILDCDLDDPDTRLTLAIALAARRLQDVPQLHAGPPRQEPDRG